MNIIEMVFRIILLVFIVSQALTEHIKQIISEPQDCKWSAWVEHSCSATCGERVMRTMKRIKLQDAANGGRRCRGATKRIVPCNLSKCENAKMFDDFEYKDHLGNYCYN